MDKNDLKEMQEYQEILYNSKGYQEQMEAERKSSIELFTKLFALRLKRLRTERGLTQKQVAMQLAVKVSTYANWEQGRREPSIYDLWKIIIDLKISANELFDNLLEEPE